MVIGNHDADPASLRRRDHVAHRRDGAEFHIEKSRGWQEFPEELFPAGRGQIPDAALGRMPHRQQDRQLRARQQRAHLRELPRERIHADLQQVHLPAPEACRQPCPGCRMDRGDDQRPGQI